MPKIDTQIVSDVSAFLEGMLNEYGEPNPNYLSDLAWRWEQIAPALGEVLRGLNIKNATDYVWVPVKREKISTDRHAVDTSGLHTKGDAHETV